MGEPEKGVWTELKNRDLQNSVATQALREACKKALGEVQYEALCQRYKVASEKPTVNQLRLLLIGGVVTARPDSLGLLRFITGQETADLNTKIFDAAVDQLRQLQFCINHTSTQDLAKEDSVKTDLNALSILHERVLWCTIEKSNLAFYIARLEELNKMWDKNDEIKNEKKYLNKLVEFEKKLEDINADLKLIEVKQDNVAMNLKQEERLAVIQNITYLKAIKITENKLFLLRGKLEEKKDPEAIRGLNEAIAKKEDELNYFKDQLKQKSVKESSTFRSSLFSFRGTREKSTANRPLIKNLDKLSMMKLDFLRENLLKIHNGQPVRTICSSVEEENLRKIAIENRKKKLNLPEDEQEMNWLTALLVSPNVLTGAPDDRFSHHLELEFKQIKEDFLNDWRDALQLPTTFNSEYCHKIRNNIREVASAEYIARMAIIKLQEQNLLNAVQGQIMPLLNEDGSTELYEVHTLVHEKGLVGYALIPLQPKLDTKNEKFVNPVRIVFRGTHSAESVERDFQKTPGIVTFQKYQAGIIDRIGEVMQTLQKRSQNAKMSLSVYGHSLGGADAQNCYVAITTALLGQSDVRQNLSGVTESLPYSTPKGASPEVKTRMTQAAQVLQQTKAQVSERAGALVRMREAISNLNLYLFNSPGVDFESAILAKENLEFIKKDIDYNITPKISVLKVAGDPVQRFGVVDIGFNLPKETANVIVYYVRAGFDTAIEKLWKLLEGLQSFGQVHTLLSIRGNYFAKSDILDNTVEGAREGICQHLTDKWYQPEFIQRLWGKVNASLSDHLYGKEASSTESPPDDGSGKKKNAPP